MVDYANVNEALERLAEEARRYLRAEGAAAERVKIVAELRQALGLDDGRHARHNLDGALIDIERDAEFRADHVCLETIRRVREQLADVERIIERGKHAQLDLTKKNGE